MGLSVLHYMTDKPPTKHDTPLMIVHNFTMTTFIIEGEARETMYLVVSVHPSAPPLTAELVDIMTLIFGLRCLSVYL